MMQTLVCQITFDTCYKEALTRNGLKVSSNFESLLFMRCREDGTYDDAVMFTIVVEFILVS